MVKKPTVFYGWFVVVACLLVTITLGETYWSYGVFFKPLENEFGWNRALTSSGYAAFLIGYVISLVISGRLADRYSPRTILLATALVGGLGITLCSQVNSINQLRIFLLITGLGTGGTWSLPSATVQRWFYKRQRAGLALAIVVSGVGIGVLIFTPLLNYLILSYGWRNTYLIAGIIFFVLIAISALMIKQSPAEEKTDLENEKSIPKSANSQGWTTGKVITTSAFIGIAFLFAVNLLASQVVVVHLIPHATDVGISSTIAAAAFGLVGGFSIPGRLMAGILSERIGWQRILTLMFLGKALPILWLIFLKATWMVYVFSFFYGIFHGAIAIALVAILGKFFGMRSIAELIGITTALGLCIGAFAPYVAGFIFDATGSYLVAFVIVAAFLLSASFVATIVKEPTTTPD